MKETDTCKYQERMATNSSKLCLPVDDKSKMCVPLLGDLDVQQ